MCYESGDTLISREELFIRMKKCFNKDFNKDSNKLLISRRNGKMCQPKIRFNNGKYNIKPLYENNIFVIVVANKCCFLLFLFVCFLFVVKFVFAFFLLACYITCV